MYRALVFVVFIVAATAADDKMAKCGRIFHPATFRCCNAGPMEGKPNKQAFESELKECFEMPRQPFSCAMDECIAKKKGYLTSDGELDKEAFGDLTEKELGLEAEKIALIKDNCINGDISKYGPPDMCELMKMKHCTHVQLLKNCPEWDDKGACNGIKELFEECDKLNSL